jgi:hypothetical protein
VRLRPVAVAGPRELVHGERESFSDRPLHGSPIRVPCRAAAPPGGVTLSRQATEFSDQVLTGDPALDHPAQRLTGVLIDD